MTTFIKNRFIYSGMNLIKNVSIYFFLVITVLFCILCFAQYEVIKLCQFYYYDITNNSYFIVLNTDKKYIKDDNKLKLTYKDTNVTIYLYGSPVLQNDYAMYNFYSITNIEFDYGLNQAKVNYGKEKCLNLIF
ncbi:MAG: hypothetical protein Ta2E_08630 [Mycoplasmoidaceae bacterium]|nr:MAG: hypothetical protein Ta2E_08630 [Mycoplasmoidaceae bacterium]